MVREIRISENIYRIVGLDEEDVGTAYIQIKKNGVVKCEYPVSLIAKLGFILFPDMPIEYDKTKDKIEFVIGCE